MTSDSNATAPIHAASVNPAPFSAAKIPIISATHGPKNGIFLIFLEKSDYMDFIS